MQSTGSKNTAWRGGLDNYVPEPNSGCWLWLGTVDAGGYGRAKIDGKYVLAHRAMYAREVGEIGDGLEIDHLCSMRSCINPRHLQTVTPAVNSRRSRATKLRPASVSWIRDLWLTGKWKQVEIASMFGVAQSTVAKIVLNQLWKEA
jgi:hypothetical protein